MFKYSVLMPYHMRIPQLKSTLDSFVCHYSDRNDFEVLIMEDIKNLDSKLEHELLLRLVESYSKIMNIRSVTSGSRRCYNPCLLYNEAAELAQGEYVVITNPECMHLTNVLGGFDQRLAENPDSYVLCACIGAHQSSISLPLSTPITGDWYQHSKIRNVRCHFCSVIKKDTFKQLGGFDPMYAKGFCFEDDDWRNTVIKHNIPVISCDDLIVIHQNHTSHRDMSKSKPATYLQLHHINRRYFFQKWGRNAMTAEVFHLGEDTNVGNYGFSDC